MKQITFLTIALLFVTKLFSQSTVGNLLTITSNVPPNLTVCGTVKTFSINLSNPTPFALQNGTVTVIMPVGMNYQSGSIIGATPLSVTNNTLIFSVANMPSLTSINMTYVAFADCDILPFLSAGNNPGNAVRVDYLKNGTTPLYDIHTTSNYVVKQPNVSITNVTNQTYTGAVGDVFTRCISIVNGGLGELSEFKLTDVHAAGLQVNIVNNGVWVNTGNTETITFNSTHFSAIGDGDALFETGESITVCETIQINSCVGANSDYKAFWGCNGKECQYSTISGNVVFPGLIPNVVVQSNGGNSTATMNSCLGPGNASQQVLKIYNSGTGTAYNVALDIYQSTGGGAYNPNIGSYIDVSSITTQLFSNGSPSPLVPSSTSTTNLLNCMSASPIGQFKFTIPSIAPNDTIYIKWNTYSCCYDNCSNVGQYYINGWAYQGQYENICQNTYLINSNWGRIYSTSYVTMANNNSTPTMSDGQIGNFNFLFSSYSFYYNFPSSASSQWFLTFTVSPCLSYSGNFNLYGNDGITTYSTPASVVQVGNIITATFNGKPPINQLIEGGGVSLDLLLTCGSCVNTNTANPNCGGGTSGPAGVSVAFSYKPNASCACDVQFGCFSVPVVFNCPSPCPEGMIFKAFDTERITLGLPDNEAGGGNGQPDGAGTLDFTKIRTDRAMFGDEFTSTYSGTIRTSAAFPSWQFAYALATITNGNRLSYVNGTLKIFRGSATVPIATCTNFTPTITNSGSTRTFKYDLSVPTLGACLPGGFNYLDGDSVVFIPQYKVTTNIGGAILPCAFTNAYYVSPIANPTLCNDKYQCRTNGGSISIIGYHFYNWDSDALLSSSCNNITISQNYATTIGPWAAWYSNLFPFEFRNWDHPKTLQVTVPVGYEFLSATIQDFRNAGTGVSANQTRSITPLSTATNTLVFDSESQFQGYGGTLPLKDDGGYGVLRVILRPSCAVVQDIKQPVKYEFTFEPIAQLTGAGAYPTVLQWYNDTIRYDGPDLVLQSNLISVNVPNDTTGWTLNLSNNANVAAHNVWIAAPTISGVSAIRFYDLTSNTLITPVGGIYQLGTLNAAASKNYLMVADFTSCSPDSIIAYAGWNCSGYPTSVADYPCTPLKLTLKEVPLLPNLVTTAQGPTGSIPLCSTTSYTVAIDNVQLGTAYTVSLTAILPTGVTIVPGSSQLTYPSANNFVTIGDPVFVSGTQWRWDLSASNGTLNADGLKGVLEASLSKVILTFDVIAGCGYTSGSAINFQTKAFAACGAPTGDEVALSTNLSITGADTPYNTDIDMRTTFISPCNFTTPMQIAIRNQGPQATQNTDSVIVELPYGVSYVTGSFVGNTNAPLNTIPYQYTLNNKTYLMWKLPAGVAVSDSVVFTFNYAGDPNKLACVVSPFKTSTIFKQELVCVTGSTCTISTLTGVENLNVFTYKAYLSLSGGSATSVPTATGEIVTLDFTINNGGEAIQAGTPTTIKYFADSNNNGIYNTGDVFITSDVFTNSILNNGTYSYSATINVPSGLACKIIAVLDTSVNKCSCTPTEILLTPLFKNAGPDLYVCSAVSGTIGLLATSNYTYTWAPAINATNPSNATTAVTHTNATNSTETHTYILTTDRGGCIITDTALVNIYPLPTITSNTAIVCTGQQSATLTANGAVTYTWNTGETTADNVEAPLVETNYTITGTDANTCVNTGTTTMFVYPTPTLTTNSATICVGQQTAALTVSGASTYTWSTLETTASINVNPLATTVYTVLGFDTNGCYSYTTANVHVNNLPIVSATSATICVGQQTATITANGATTYTWSTLETTATVTQTPLVTTTYSVFGTDANGCINTTTTSVLVNSLPIISINAPHICLGETTTLTANGANTYTWSTIQTGASIAQTPTITSTYTVIGTDGNTCYSSATTIITVHALPIPAFTADSVCFNVASTLTDASNGNGSSLTNYEWDFNNDLTIDAMGSFVTNVFPNNGINVVNYTVTTTPVVGLTCKTSTTQNVWVNPLPQPAFSFTNNCENTQPNYFNAYASVIAIGTNSLYTWSFGDTQTSTGISPVVSHTYSLAGPYTVTLIVTSNKGCESSITHTVEVYPKPRMQIVTNSKVCLGSTTTFSANTMANSGNVTTWQWDVNNFIPSIETSGQNSSYVFATPGAHTLTVLTITDHFCRDTTKLPVYVNYFPIPQFTITNPTGCEVHCVTFIDATQNVPAPDKVAQWQWNFGDGTVVTNNTNVGPINCYSVAGIQVTNFSATLTTQTDSGCVASVSHPNIITVYPKPIANFNVVPELGNVLVPQVSFQNQSIDYTSWVWNFGDGTDKDSVNLNPTHYYDNHSANNYQTTLIVTNQYGCSDTAINVLEISPEFVFYIPNAFSPNTDNINEVFTGMGIGIAKYEMWIYDRWGEQIFYTDEITKGWNGRKQGSSVDCKQDVYIWKVELRDIFDKKHNYVGHVTLLR